jgi:outer membrane protein insertion porin family
MYSVAMCNEISSNLISNFSISGLHNIKQKKVLDVIKLKNNKIYSVGAAKKDIRSILNLGYFDDVEINYNNSSKSILFTVIEKPYIEKIIFKGNYKFSNYKLKNTSLLKEEKYYNLYDLDETKKKILDLYYKDGYINCKIDIYPTIVKDTNKITITFLITENNRVVINDFIFIGTKYRKNKLLKHMKLKRKMAFIEQTFKTDLENLEIFYKNNGFFDYKLINYDIVYDKRDKFCDNASIYIHINEGKKYNFGTVTFHDTYIIDKNKVSNILKTKKNYVFSEKKVSNIIQKIRELYLDNGYFNVFFDYVIDKNDNTIDIKISADEGSQSYLRNIYISGLASTKEKVIRREILLKQGDMLSSTKIRKSISNIYNLGFIEKVETNFINTDFVNIFDLNFSATESISGLFAVGLGYDTNNKIFGTLESQFLNLFNRGQKLGMILNIGKNKERLSNIDWTVPWFLNKNMSMNLFLFDSSSMKNYDNIVDAYRERRKGASIKIIPKIDKYNKISFGYLFEKVDVSKHSNENYNKKEDVTSILLEHIYDSRDYVLDPSSGQIHKTSLQFASTAFGGDVGFFKTTLKSSLFHKLFWKFVGSINTEFGFITKLGKCNDNDNNTKRYKNNIPMYEEFSIGGLSSVRGYERGFNSDRGHKNGIDIGSHTGSYKNNIPMYEELYTGGSNSVRRNERLNSDRGYKNGIDIGSHTGSYKNNIPMYEELYTGGSNSVRRNERLNSDRGHENGIDIGSHTGSYKSNIPIYEEFSIGGSNSVRGYKNGIDIGSHTGAKIKGIVSFECKFPIVSNGNKTMLQGIFFYDIGGTWKRIGDINLKLGNMENNLRSSIGFGIKVLNFAFPINIGYGYGLNHNREIKKGHIFFTASSFF